MTGETGRNRRDSGGNRKVEFAATEKAGTKPRNNPGSPEESFARLLADMDKNLNVEVKDKNRYVRLGGRLYGFSAFRAFCTLANRCFSCGGRHLIASCPRKDRPLFPQNKFGAKGGYAPSNKEATKEPVVKPWPKADVKAITEEWEDGVYLYTRNPESDPEDEFTDDDWDTDFQDDGDSDYPTVSTLAVDSIYADLGEEYNHDIAAVELLPIQGMQPNDSRFEILPIAQLQPVGSGRVSKRTLGNGLRPGEIPIVWEAGRSPTEPSTIAEVNTRPETNQEMRTPEPGVAPVEGALGCGLEEEAEVWSPGEFDEPRNGEILIQWECVPLF